MISAFLRCAPGRGLGFSPLLLQHGSVPRLLALAGRQFGTRWTGFPCSEGRRALFEARKTASGGTLRGPLHLSPPRFRAGSAPLGRASLTLLYIVVASIV